MDGVRHLPQGLIRPVVSSRSTAHVVGNERSDWKASWHELLGQNGHVDDPRW